MLNVCLSGFQEQPLSVLFTIFAAFSRAVPSSETEGRDLAAVMSLSWPWQPPVLIFSSTKAAHLKVFVAEHKSMSRHKSRSRSGTDNEIEVELKRRKSSD